MFGLHGARFVFSLHGFPDEMLIGPVGVGCGVAGRHARLNDVLLRKQ